MQRFSKLRAHVASNAVAYLALFVALGGSSYAATTIGTGEIKDNSVRSRDIRNGTIRGRDTARALGLRCPHGTRYHEGACIDTALRPAILNWASARAVCLSLARRLPTLAELENFRLRPGITLATNGEWTNQRRQTIDDAGTLSTQANGSRAYRCVKTAR
jgi:hypothetical protein